MARHCRPCFLACGIALLLAGAPGPARADFAVTDLRINVETTGIAVNRFLDNRRRQGSNAS